MKICLKIAILKDFRWNSLNNFPSDEESIESTLNPMYKNFWYFVKFQSKFYEKNLKVFTNIMSNCLNCYFSIDFSEFFLKISHVLGLSTWRAPDKHYLCGHAFPRNFLRALKITSVLNEIVLGQFELIFRGKHRQIVVSEK